MAFNKKYLNQRGAMFGMDARISIAIFGAISVIAGGYAASNLGLIRGQAFTDEIRKTSAAVETLMQDLQGDIYKNLQTANAQNAYQALYDVSKLKTGKPQARWVGPYVEHQSDQHTRYGDLRIEKKEADRTTDCTTTAGCFLWLTYSAVPSSVTLKVNESYDTAGEATPKSQGRIQWDDASTPYKLWYKIGRAIN